MRGVTKSTAGRAAILELLPFSIAETPKSTPARRFPEGVLRPRSREPWFASYLQTYIEPDVRLISNIRNLARFRRFLTLLASRHGQVLNRTDLAARLCTKHCARHCVRWIDWTEVQNLRANAIYSPAPNSASQMAYRLAARPRRSSQLLRPRQSLRLASRPLQQLRHLCRHLRLSLRGLQLDLRHVPVAHRRHSG
jgi:hypothetical protein